MRTPARAGSLLGKTCKHAELLIHRSMQEIVYIGSRRIAEADGNHAPDVAFDSADGFPLCLWEGELTEGQALCQWPRRLQPGHLQQAADPGWSGGRGGLKIQHLAQLVHVGMEALSDDAGAPALTSASKFE